MKSDKNIFAETASRVLSIVIAIGIAVTLQGCGDKASDAVNLHFNEDFKYELYDGRQVIVRGYMSTMSPMDGKFIYLMNIPYQNCPFCLPNTTTIVNTVAVYSKAGNPFDFYDGPIEITGTLKVGDTVDDFGYGYPFKIENATYSKLDTSKLSENLKTYGALTQDGIITDIINTASRTDFNAFFELYGATAADIDIVADAEYDGILRRINAISETGYSDIIAIVEDLKEYNEIVNTNISASEYSSNCTQDMEDEIIRLLNTFFGWINKFEI